MDLRGCVWLRVTGLDGGGGDFGLVGVNCFVGTSLGFEGEFEGEVEVVDGIENGVEVLVGDVTLLSFSCTVGNGVFVCCVFGMSRVLVGDACDC